MAPLPKSVPGLPGALALVFAVGVAALAGPGPADVPPASPAAARDTVPGLVFRLTETSSPRAEPPGVERAPLSRSEVTGLLAGLSELPRDTAAEGGGAPREGPRPPPPGRTVGPTFSPGAEPPGGAPGGATPGVPDGETLEVVHHGPRGEADRSARVTLTFSRPMVPVSSRRAVEARALPVRMRPSPPGRWRWVGTRTLVFQPDASLPMATRYEVELPAGVASATGERLADGLRWTFTTAPPRLVGALPRAGRTTDRDPLMALSFDQEMDADSVLSRLRVTADDRARPVRLATAAEIEAEEAMTRWLDRRRPGRTVVLRASAPLPRDARIAVTVPAGTPSGEGPVRTDTAQAFEFRTYGPLDVAEATCRSGDADLCRPGQSWHLRMTNRLDGEAFADSLVRIEPPLPGARVTARREWITIAGASEPRRRYRVFLDPRLRDTFGQRLGRTDTATFEVGPVPPSLASRGGPFVALDPEGPRALAVRSVNLDALAVRLYRVEPGDWFAFEEGRRSEDRLRGRVPAPPGRPVRSDTVAVEAAPDRTAETLVDLAPALGGGSGQVVMVVEPAGDSAAADLRPVHAWVQATRLGLDAFVDRGTVVARVTSLEEGRPLEDARVTVLPDGGSAATGPDGLAEVALRPPPGPGRRLVVARRGDEVAVLPVEAVDPDGKGARELRWHVFGDRPLYRPGDRVRLKGWVRTSPAGGLSPPELPGPSVDRVTYVAKDRFGTEVAAGEAALNDAGGFDLAFRLPPLAETGRITVELSADPDGALAGRRHEKVISVQEFRRPRFEVELEREPGPFVVGDGASLAAVARYFSGGRLSDATVRWTARTRPARFTPPDRDGYVFGVRPWRWPRERSLRSLSSRTDARGRHAVRLDFLESDPPLPMLLEVTATATDLDRRSRTASTSLLVHPSSVHVGLRSERRFVRRGEPLPVDVIAVDGDGEAVAGRPVELRMARLDWERRDGSWHRRERDPRTCRVEPGDRPARCVFETPVAGAYRVTATTRDREGRPALTELRVWAGGRGWDRTDGPATEPAVTLLPDRSTYGPGDTARILVQAPFAPAEGVLTLRRSGLAGVERFRMEGPSRVLRVPILEAHIPNLHVRVDLTPTGPRTREWPVPTVVSGTAELAVSSLLRTLQVRAEPRERTVEPGDETAVEVEVRDARGRPTAGAEVAVAVVDEAVWALSSDSLAHPVSAFYPERPPGARQRHLLSSVVWRDHGEREIAGRVVDAETGSPVVGARVSVEEAGVGDVTDHSGRYRLRLPRPGRYTLVARLLGYQRESRVVFLSGAGGALVDLELRPASVGLAAVELSGGVTRLPPPPGGSVELRADFDPVAAFVPSVRTDARGRATVAVRVPDNLTRYRVIAVAVHGATRFGKDESSLAASLPLMVRPSPPRFLHHGDRFELPIVVQNPGDTALTAEVAVGGTNLEWTGARGERLTLPPRGRAEVRFPARPERPGPAWFQVVGAAGRSADAVRLSLPVRTPAVPEAFATYGEVEHGAVAIPLEPPDGVLPTFGGLEVTVSSTALHALSDALLYLTGYPYECTEQTASRVLAVVELRDVLSVFGAGDLPDAPTLRDSVRRDLRMLERLQNRDGGFSFWGPGQESWPFVSAHVVHALVRARGAGFRVRDEVLESGLEYLARLEASGIPDGWPESARQAVLAYGLHVRALAGDRDPAAVTRLLRRRSLRDAPLEALAWSLSVLASGAEPSGEPGGAGPSPRDLLGEVRREILNRAVEEAGTAHFATGHREGSHLVLHSRRRADALALAALLADRPDHPLLPKLVRGLLGHRRKGRWRNTQENAFALLSLARYFEVAESETPDYTAHAWLGERYLGGHAFRGRSADRLAIEVPMDRFLSAADAGGPAPGAAAGPGAPAQPLVVAREGSGRLYYRVGLRYAPAGPGLEPAVEGFAVERSYEAVDDPGDVRRGEDGAWIVRAGARVRVRLELVAPGRRHHVALVDRLPAGLEPLNPELRGTGARVPAPDGGGERRASWRRWYEHESLRDDRAEAFASTLRGGVYGYSYLARATTPGEYVVPAPRAEEMYRPETFGRGGTARLVVR